MSKLSTLLRRAGRSEPAPMGFATSAGRTKNPEMIICVSLDDLTVEAAVAASKGGANMLLLTDAEIVGDAAAISAITAAVDIPCGLRLDRPEEGTPEAAKKLGLDYLRIEDHDTPAAALLDEEVGFVLSLEDDVTDTFLRTLESMSFDALYAGELSRPFTLRRQLELRRIAGMAHRPLILRARDSFSSRDLECLRDSGVAAMLIEGGSGSEESLAALRSSVDAMRPRRRNRTEREATMATIPSVAHSSEDADDEDD
jgi:hypothetical protein